MKDEILIVYGSLNSVPSPEGAAPAKVIYETVNSEHNLPLKVLSNHNPKLETLNYDRDTFYHIKPNSVDKLKLLSLKLRYPYKKRKHKFITSSDKQLLFFIAVCRFIKSKGYNKIIVHVSVGLVNMIKLLLPNRAIIFYHHGTSLHSKYDEIQWSRLLQNTKGIIGVNKIALQKANEKFKTQLDPSKYFAIPNAIKPVMDIDFAKHLYRERREKDNTFVFAFSGRICIEKGVLNLLHAFKKVYEQNKDVRLIVFGAAGTRATHDLKTDYLLKCHEYASQANIPIEFTGFLHNNALLKAISKIDVLILPTDNKLSEEGMPLSLIEGMSLGKPIIATNSGGNSELVIDNENGFLITSHPYIEELYKAILKISLDKGLYEKFSEVTYQSYIENHTYDGYNIELSKALKAIYF